MSSTCNTCDIDNVRINPGLRSIGGRPLGNGVNEMTCGDCGRTWNTRDRYEWCPLSFNWSKPLPGIKSKFFGWHAFQVGWYDLDARLFAQVFHIGQLRIILGKRADKS